MKIFEFTETAENLRVIEKYETAADLLEVKSYAVLESYNTSTGKSGKDLTPKAAIFLNGNCVGFGTGYLNARLKPNHKYTIKSRIEYLERQIKGYQEF